MGTWGGCACEDVPVVVFFVELAEGGEGGGCSVYRCTGIPVNYAVPPENVNELMC